MMDEIKITFTSLVQMLRYIFPNETISLENSAEPDTIIVHIECEVFPGSLRYSFANQIAYDIEPEWETFFEITMTEIQHNAVRKEIRNALLFSEEEYEMDQEKKRSNKNIKE